MEALEILRKRHRLTTMKIVIPQCGIYRDSPLPPHFSLCVPDFPIVAVISVVRDVAADGNERGVGLRNPLHQCPADRRAGSPDVCRVGESRVAVHDETERRFSFRMQLDWLNLGRRL